MDIREMAHACIALWNQLKFREVYETYYSSDAVKVEPTGFGEAYGNTITGADKLADHEEWIWENWAIVHSIKIVDGPFIGASGFSVTIDSDFTMRESGERQTYREVAFYTVKEGKIVREEFFYSEDELEEAIRLSELETQQSN